MRSATKKQVQIWQQLSQKKGRDTHHLFLAEGLRCTTQLLANPNVKVAHIVIADSTMRDEFPVAYHPLCVQVSKKDLVAISEVPTPQPVLGIFQIPEFPIAHIRKWKSGTILYLDRIQDPGNLGTLIRTAVWFGCTAICFAKGCADPFQPKVVRSTAGATASIPYFWDYDYELATTLQDDQWAFFVTKLDDKAEDITRLSPGKKNIIVLGNEARGASDFFNKPAFQHVYISGAGNHLVESLNAAISGGIVLHHFAQTKKAAL